MKIYYIFLLLLFVVLPLSAQVNVIPQPNKIEYHKGSCPLKTPITYITDNSIPSKEGYELIVQPKKIILKFSSKAGKFYAEQTLAQLIFQAEQESK